MMRCLLRLFTLAPLGALGAPPAAIANTVLVTGASSGLGLEGPRVEVANEAK